LIGHFGGLGRALVASREQLEVALAGDPELVETIVAARSLFEAGLHERVSRTKISAQDPHFHSYLRHTIGKSAVERVHATFVTPDWGYLADNQIATGTAAQVDISLRFLIGRAFDVGAHGVLLAHNHPSGSAEPSDSDIALTRRIAGLTRSVGVELIDHLIVGSDAIVSMKERGVL
jgi:DNA repair protein RadC